MAGATTIRCTECGARHTAGPDGIPQKCTVCGSQLPGANLKDSPILRTGQQASLTEGVLGQLGKIPDGNEAVDLEGLLESQALAKPKQLARIELKASPRKHAKPRSLPTKENAAQNVQSALQSKVSGETEDYPDGIPSSFMQDLLKDGPLRVDQKLNHRSIPTVESVPEFEKPLSNDQSARVSDTEGSSSPSRNVAAELFGVGVSDASSTSMDHPDTDDSPASTWRVRNAKGIVYEFASRDAVSAWIKQRTNIIDLQVSEGDGPFSEVTAFGFVHARPADAKPEISALQSADSPKQEDGEQMNWDLDAPGPLVLDRKRMAAPLPREGLSLPARPRPEHATGIRKVGSAKELTPGFRLTVGLLIFGLIFSFWASHSSGVDDKVLRAALSELTAVAPDAGKQVSAQRVRAFQDLESGNYTAAVIRLERLWENEKDPAILRHLALALYRSDRQDEALEMLREFRKQTASR